MVCKLQVVMGWGGRVSDKHLGQTNNDKLIAEDFIFDDRGFTV